jgi:hypothetical protein
LSKPRAEGDFLRDVFRQRARQAMEQIARSASLEALARALEAPTDFGAVARALGSSTVAEAVALDPLADVLARGVVERERLAAQAGGLLSASEIGRSLGGISRQAVDKRRRALQLLAVRVAGDWRYPAAQVEPDGEVPPSLPAILQAGMDVGMHGWAMLDFLLTPDQALGGSTPLESLRLESAGAADVQRLLEAAKVDAYG